MILPSKHLSQQRALLSVGAKILQHLQSPKTVSAIWEELTKAGDDKALSNMGYNSFILTLDLLYSISAIEMEGGLLSVKKHD